MEEETTDGLKSTTLQATWTPANRPNRPIAREVLEETAHDFRAHGAGGGVPQPLRQDAQRATTSTYLRFVFAGTLGTHHSWRTLDTGILRTVRDDAR